MVCYGSCSPPEADMPWQNYSSFDSLLSHAGLRYLGKGCTVPINNIYLVQQRSLLWVTSKMLKHDCNNEKATANSEIRQNKCCQRNLGYDVAIKFRERIDPRKVYFSQIEVGKFRLHNFDSLL